MYHLPIHSFLTEISGVAVNFDTADSLGVDITVWTSCEDFSAMGYIVDQLDSLIDEWFPGKLRDCGSEGKSKRLRNRPSMSTVHMYMYMYTPCRCTL